MPSSTDPSDGPDALFSTEFGKGDLAKRLWRGGLRVSTEGYRLVKSIHDLVDSVEHGFQFEAEEKATALVNAIETVWNDVERMRSACKPLKGASEPNELYSSSLVRVLLGVEELQPPLVTCVINKMSEFGDDLEREKEISVLLLSQLKWLDFVVDSRALCENLLAIVDVVCPQMQRNIIEGLPEILDDRARSDAVKDLVGKLRENPSIMGSVIDALGALGVKHESVEEVNAAVVTTLASANRDIIPSSIRYLFRTTSSVLFESLFDNLRASVALPGLGLGPGRLCLDALRDGFRMNNSFSEFVVKTLRKKDRTSDFRPADIWMMLALFDAPAQRKHVEVLFKKKAAANLITVTALDGALAPFADSFTELLDNLICMAALIIKAQEPSARKTGALMYEMLFRLFQYGNSRRNVLNSLLEHTGCRRPNEVEGALDALILIAKKSEDSRILLPHSALIHGLLDFIETFSDSQVRQIWTLLAILCRSSLKKASSGKEKSENLLEDSENEDEKDKQDEEEVDDLFEENASELSTLEILLRKELTHVDTMYRRIGVIGASTMIKVLGAHVRKNIFNLLFDAGRSQAFTQALAFDELSNILPAGEECPKNAVKHISGKVSECFESLYVADCNTKEDATASDIPDSILWSNLDGPDVDVCIPIYRLIANSKKTKANLLDSVRSLAPGLRLLCILTEMTDNGDLESVDAVLGCPIRMPCTKNVAEFQELTASGKRITLLAFFAAHGWIVELVNAFAGQNNAEFKSKCMKRLENLIYIADTLSLFCGLYHGWNDVLFDSYQTAKALSYSMDTSEPSGKRGKKSTSNNSGTSDSKCFEWKKLARKLEPRALGLLRISHPVKYSETDFQTENVGSKSVKKVAELESKSLHYLLQDLMGYILASTESEVASAAKKGNFLPATVLQVESNAGTRKKIGDSRGKTDVTDAIDLVKKLKTSLVSLAPQLSRALKRGLQFRDNDDNDDNFQDLILFKESAVLCLKSWTGVCIMSSLRDNRARMILFDILASIRFDDSPVPTISDPPCNDDICAAAKLAFNQLRNKLLQVCEDTEAGSTQLKQEELEEGLASNNEEFGIEGHVSFLAALESILLLCNDSDREQLTEKLSDSAGRFLERNWGDTTMKSKTARSYLPGVVRVFIQYAKNPFDTLKELAGRLSDFSKHQQELRQKTLDSQELHEGDAELDYKNKGWGSLTPSSYHSYCNAVFEQFVRLFIALKPGAMDNTDQAFQILNNYLESSKSFFELARNNDKVLKPAMKSGRLIVDQFIKVCIPFLKDKFSNYRGQVVKTLKATQKTTRLLHVYCQHSKSIRDGVLTQLVPPLRKTLEVLLYRVKDVMESKNQASAFTLGNLKHRNIAGEVIGSQEQYRSDSDDDQTESECDSDEDENEDLPRTAKTAKRQLTPLKRARAKTKVRASLDTMETMPETNRAGSKKSPRMNSQRKKALSSRKTIDEAKLNEVKEEPVVQSSIQNESDEEEQLIHSLAPPTAKQEEDDEDEVSVRRKRPAKKGKYNKKAVKALVEMEAEEADDEEDDPDATSQDDMSQFIVEDSECSS